MITSIIIGYFSFQGNLTSGKLRCWSSIDGGSIKTVMQANYSRTMSLKNCPIVVFALCW